MQKFLNLCCFTALAFCLSLNLYGDDWPMWRHDAGRSGASKENLPTNLCLQWTRELPRLTPAWPNEPRLLFDASYEPVVMDKTLFLALPSEGAVTAYDTETGAEKWKFYANGPVRFAPVAWKDRLFVGSDDGRLYCLDAANGSIQWTFRAAPEDCPEARHLGNSQLVSYWPVRGGPVLAEDTIYLTSGIWPTMGVFAYALDAKTGRRLWKNDTLHFVPDVRIDHNFINDSALSPQGYLAIEGDKLLAPNGRSLPAGLDRTTGRLLYYLQGYRNGHCRVTVADNYAFAGPTGLIDTRTGREMGSQSTTNNPRGPSMVGESPYFQYKFAPGCDAWSALDAGVAYGSELGIFYAYDLRNAKFSTYEEKGYYSEKFKPARWDPPEVWKLATPYATNKPMSRALIKAGNRLYGHAGKKLIAFDLPAAGAIPKIAWEEELGGIPSSLVAADGKLFVATENGRLYGFGGKAGTPINHKREPRPLAKADDAWKEKASQILNASGAREGYGLVLGLESGRLVDELLLQSQLKIIVIESDLKKVNALRDRLVAAGLYGERAQTIQGDPLKFSYPPYLASLVTSETLQAADFARGMDAGKLVEILRPYGGAACLASTNDRLYTGCISKTGLKQNMFSKTNGFQLIRRAGPLPGSAPWTHETADAARSYCSQDELVKPPLGILWYGDDINFGLPPQPGYDHGLKPEVIGGRLFLLQVAGGTLVAMDVYTGRFLWKVKTTSGLARCAAMEDGVYLATDNTCVVYDAANGQVLRKFTYDPDFESGVKPGVTDIRVADDVIIVSVAPAKKVSLLWESRVIVALDRASGRQLWRKEAKESFNNNALTAGDGLVFVTDSISDLKGIDLKRQGKAPATTESVTSALDARTGETRWAHRATRKFSPSHAPDHAITYRVTSEWLAYSEECEILLVAKAKDVTALDSRDGHALWSKKISGPPPVIVKGDTFVHQWGLVFDIQTGEQVKDKMFFHTNAGGYFGCNYGVGGEHLFFLREVSATYVDASSGDMYHLRNTRSSCNHNLIAADGVLTIPNVFQPCICNYPIQTAFAMVPMPFAARWAVPTREIKLFKPE